MRTWSLERAASGTALANEAVANIVGTIGEKDFSKRVLHQINRVLPVGCWSVYRVGGPAPKMFLSSTYLRKDTTTDSWNAYLSGPHLVDQTFASGKVNHSGTAITHLTAQEVPAKVHRDKVYKQFDMSERLSVVERQPDDAVFALNFYRYNDQRFFNDREFAAFQVMASLLLVAVRRHLVLQAQQGSPDSTLSVESVRRAFEAYRCDLTERELDVVARTVLGMSYEGIAADLGIGLPTVKTYRNRAFDRLGIHFRNELLKYYLLITVGTRAS